MIGITCSCFFFPSSSTTPLPIFFPPTILFPSVPSSFSIIISLLLLLLLFILFILLVEAVVVVEEELVFKSSLKFKREEKIESQSIGCSRRARLSWKEHHRKGFMANAWWKHWEAFWDSRSLAKIRPSKYQPNEPWGILLGSPAKSRC